MNNKRLGRISEEVRKVVSEIIASGLKDPRINPMTTVTNVEVTRDLRYARIFVSVLGDDREKNETIKGLENAKGFLRREISSKVDLRYTPEPMFILDESIEKGIYMSKLIEEVNKNSRNQEDKIDE